MLLSKNAFRVFNCKISWTKTSQKEKNLILLKTSRKLLLSSKICESPYLDLSLSLSVSSFFASDALSLFLVSNLSLSPSLSLSFDLSLPLSLLSSSLLSFFLSSEISFLESLLSVSAGSGGFPCLLSSFSVSSFLSLSSLLYSEQKCMKNCEKDINNLSWVNSFPNNNL